MFGYVNVNKPELKLREFAEYKGYYCGLCHMLRDKYGLDAGLTLTYDMTFLIILLSSLYEPKLEIKKRRCPIHPLKKQYMIRNEITEYAADMNLLLARDNLRDDWEDERSIKAYLGKWLFDRRADFVESRYPRQAEAISGALKELSQIERDHMYRWSEMCGADYDTTRFVKREELLSRLIISKKKTNIEFDKIYDNLEAEDLDKITRPFAKMMAEIVAMKDDAFAPILKRFGYHLGKYIYIKDALCDLEKDIKNASFNPFLMTKMTKDYRAWIDQCQQATLGACIAEFEKLPLDRDLTILRNIIYEGIKMSGKKHMNGVKK
ncbi:MAG: DUF5685 family protein [Eubacterium sp.]|nr:DUF5685 family protein [Eubacterium sp.]